MDKRKKWSAISWEGMFGILLGIVIGIVALLHLDSLILRNYSAEKQIISSKPQSIDSEAQSNKSKNIYNDVDLSSKIFTSEFLKISFEYPIDWYLLDYKFYIVITTYPKRRGENIQPSKDQLEISINSFPYCFDNLEKDLMYPACGERLPEPYKIIFKEVKDLDDKTYYKYKTIGSSGDVHIYNLIKKGKADPLNVSGTLRIDKTPESSQYEKEFDEFINSIKFLD